MSKKILIVDDERVIADTLAAILRRSGYESKACYDAKSAIADCASVVPDLVITDVMMPGMNGVDLAIVISEQHPGCKVLLFSGMANAVDLLEEARRRGHNFALLGKPIHPSELLAVLADEENFSSSSNAESWSHRRRHKAKDDTAAA